MKSWISGAAFSGLFLTLSIAQAQAASPVHFGSPGFASSQMDAQGQLLEDWGKLGFKLAGPGFIEQPQISVNAIQLDGIIPAARARANYGPVTLKLTAFRSPAWPAGLDVCEVRLEESSGHEQHLRLVLDLPEGAHLGAKTVSLAGRTILTLPSTPNSSQIRRDWGWEDDAVPMPGWARPDGACDPAFRNIRAGMNGVPIHYRFKTEPKAAFNVVLGFCESHWEQSGQRPVICQVEGAPSQELDPVARWGQHKPGAVLFQANDKNADGFIDVAVLPVPNAADQNPILNAIWLFPSELTPDLPQVVAGKLNQQAAYYVDVGGAKDQSLVMSGKVEYDLTLPAQGSQSMTFLVACPGGSAPLADRTAWTSALLRSAALQVWRDWKK